jgi:hypothetical protein
MTNNIFRDEGASEQVIRIERLTMPPPETRLRSAQYLDVLEVSIIHIFS